MPLSDLSPWVIAYLAPVLTGGARRGGAEEKPANDWCAGRPFGVKEKELHAGVSQTIFRRQVENKELVEDGVRSTFFYVRLLLTHSLLSLVKVHLHVRF